MLDVVTITLRRSAHLAIVVLVAWFPAAYEMYVLATTAVHIPSLTGFLSQVDSAPTESLTGIVGDLSQAKTHGLLLVLATVLAVCVSTGAFAHQFYRSALGRPSSAPRSLAWALGRLHRVLVAMLVLTLVMVLPIAVFIAVAGYITWLDPTGWLAALDSAWLISFFVGCLSVYLIGRLAAWPAAAALSPYLRLTWLAALRVSAARWWSVSWRLWPTVLMVTAVVCAVLSPITVMVVLGGPDAMAIGMVAAFVTIGVAFAYVPATMALPFADVDQPSRAIRPAAQGPVESTTATAEVLEQSTTSQASVELAAYAAQRLADLR